MKLSKTLFLICLTLFLPLISACDDDLSTSELTATVTASPTPDNCYIPSTGIIPLLETPTFVDPDMATITPTPVVWESTPTATPTASSTPLPFCTPTPSPPQSGNGGTSSSGSGRTSRLTTQLGQSLGISSSSGGGSGGSAGNNGGSLGSGSGGSAGNSGGNLGNSSGGNLGSGSGGTDNDTFIAITSGTGVDSLTIDILDQTILSVAAGLSGNLVFWKEGNTVLYSSTEAGENQVVRKFGEASEIFAAFSPGGRVHAVYQRDGALFYRYANKVDGLASDEAETWLASGAAPSITVDKDGWPQIAYAANGTVYHLTRGDRGWGNPARFANGSNVSIKSTQTGLIAGVREGSTIRVYRFDGRFWGHVASYTTDGSIGTPRFDVLDNLVYMAWMSEIPDPLPNDWPRRRPEYKPAFPFVNRVASGENAQQYFTTYGIHDAGVYQSFSTASGTMLMATAQYMGWSCDEPSVCKSALPNEPNPSSGSGANMRAQICIDPTGGTDIYSPAVVCSGPTNTLDSWTTLSVSVAAQGSQATLFLRTQPDLPRKTQDAYWDNVTLSGGTLIDPDFEGVFPEYNGVAELKVAEGWHPFYVEDPPLGNGFSVFKVHTAWSSDGGQSWGSEVFVTKNATSSKEKTGAFRPDVYPYIINDEIVSFSFLYMEGDPMQEGIKRYGRPVIAACRVEQDKCSEQFWRLVPGTTNRPAVQFYGDVSVLKTNRFSIMAWDAYQGSLATNKDIYSMMLTP